MSPRRSSRARTTQPPPSGPTHSNSASSVSSGRGERSTRSNNKQSSPQKSSTPHSLLSEELDEPDHTQQSEPPQTRRRTREQDNDEDAKLEDDVDDDLAEEEEITRCVCGHQDYPGPPLEVGKSKDNQIASAIDASDAQADDDGGLFIQCDTCKVWQHGGCVGIMNEAASPEEYFCEECRKDLHKVMTGQNGQKYSRYLPVSNLEPTKPRKTSVSKDAANRSSKDKDKTSKGDHDLGTKRRATMNSRAAYEEEEIIRKVIEQSKSEGGGSTSETLRKGKRGREDSEDIKVDPKRQRTGSGSLSSTTPTAESEDEAQHSKANSKQKPRGAAARSQREKEAREREKERERERAEAAGRRKERAGRRRADESDPPEDNGKDAESEQPELAASTIAPDPPAATPTATTTIPVKKRGPGPKRGKLGRNQYTRDRDLPAQSTSPHRHNARGNHKDSSQDRANGHDSNDTGSDAAKGKHSKAKHVKLEKVTLTEIKRRAASMVDFITRTQVEMATDKSTGGSVAATAIANTLAIINDSSSSDGATAIGGNSSTNGNGVVAAKEGEMEKHDFEKMSSTKMMDVLTRHLVHWQDEFGK